MQNFSEKVRMSNDDALGWFLTAANDFEVGEIILEERPILVSPHWDCERMKCTNCLQDSFIMCKDCQFFPLCLDCKKHDDFECQFMCKLIKNDAVPILKDLLVKNYAIFAVLKLLLLMENDQTTNSCDPLFSHKVHLSDDYKNSEQFREHNDQVVLPLMTSSILKSFQNVITKRGTEIDTEFLHELCYLIDVNGFEVTCRKGGESLKAVYTSGTKLPHNCLSNTVISFDDNYQMRIYAALEIKNGEQIYNSYVNPLMGTSQRQLQLRLTRQIECHCARCIDPTELGTHMSTLKCQQCSSGWILNTKPLTNGAWACNKCNALSSNDYINDLLSEVADGMAYANNDLEAYEKLLRTYEPRFHPNHFIIVDIKQNIASVLGGLLLNPYAKLERPLLERKYQLSEEVLPVVRAVQPGISKLYTVALYDNLIMFAELTELKFENKDISSTAYVTALHRVNDLFQEVVTMLSFEPSNSAEGHLAQRILMEKKHIEEQLQSVAKLTL